MGAEVRFVAPATLLPLDAEELGVRTFVRLEPALEDADVTRALYEAARAGVKIDAKIFSPLYLLGKRTAT